MDRERALEDLPGSYAVALRLESDGAPDLVIARALGVPVEAVPRLLEIGRSKLAAALEDEPPP